MNYDKRIVSDLLSAFPFYLPQNVFLHSTHSESGAFTISSQCKCGAAVDSSHPPTTLCSMQKLWGEKIGYKQRRNALEVGSFFQNLTRSMHSVMWEDENWAESQIWCGSIRREKEKPLTFHVTEKILRTQKSFHCHALIAVITSLNVATANRLMRWKFNERAWLTVDQTLFVLRLTSTLSH